MPNGEPRVVILWNKKKKAYPLLEFMCLLQSPAMRSNAGMADRWTSPPPANILAWLGLAWLAGVKSCYYLWHQFSVLPGQGRPLRRECPWRWPGLAKILHMERFSWHAAFTAVPVYFTPLPDQRNYTVNTMCVYTHISDCVQTVYELPLLPNNTAAEHLYTNRSGEKCWLNIYRWDAWLDQYVTLGRTFYRIILKQEQ